MNKNIILCADGTGNRGGETPDTNVYRMYHSVERHQPERQREQITFYDNGVGTSTNKYIRAVSGGLGFGFGRNVRQLYEFLAKNYNDGDIVYVFGFSRGAATARAFGGMLQECGLLDRNHTKCKVNGRFDYDTFVELVEQAFRHYRNGTGNRFKNEEYVHNEVRIKFMGVWDTVSALGFPYQRTGDSLIEDILERPVPVWLARACDILFNFGSLAHKFYNYTPNQIVDHVYHAISIDDERKSFLPMVWDETTPGLRGDITQVWFAGVHSDVGGSYNQTGLAYVTMAWMMERAEHHGLDFVKDSLQEARDKANVDGRLHNSRDGLAIYYRYAPRNIAELCSSTNSGNSGKLNGRIKIHQSVIERMDKPTDRYAPGLLPTEFDIVGTPIPDKNTTQPVAYGIDTVEPVDPHVVDDASVVNSDDKANSWVEDKREVEVVIRNRRRLYRVFADLTFFIVIAAVLLWNCEIDFKQMLNSASSGSSLWRLGFETSPVAIAGIELNGEILKYLTPAMFENFIDLVWVTYPTISLLILLSFTGLGLMRAKLLKATIAKSVLIREKIKGFRLSESEKPDTD